MIHNIMHTKHVIFALVSALVITPLYADLEYLHIVPFQKTRIPEKEKIDQEINEKL